MPKVSPEQTFAKIRPMAAKAISALEPQRDAILDEWQRQGRVLAVKPQEFEVLGSVDFSALKRRLQAGSFTGFRRLLINLGERLVLDRVKLEHALTAYGVLLEICVGRLAPARGKGADMALAIERLFSLAVAYLVAGCEKEGNGRLRPLNGKIAEAREYNHSSVSYITEIYERERRRFSHDLHDEVGHDLILLKLYLEIMAVDFRQGATGTLGPRLEEALDLVGQTINSVRRLVLDLGPTILDDLGFVPALRFYAKRFTANTGIDVRLEVGQMPDQIPVSHQVAIYRILQGALSNVLKHAQARKVNIALGCIKSSVLVLVIQDDGAGFEVSRVASSGSVGLTAMRERVESLEGRFHVESGGSGRAGGRRGTRIEIDLPLPESWDST